MGFTSFKRRLCVLLIIPLVGGVSLNCADEWVLPPNHAVVDPHGALRRQITVDGRAVECWVMRSPAAKSREPEAFVLFFVGKGGRVDEWVGAVAGSWGDRPVEVWGTNYPGSGGSEGPPSLARVGPDSAAAYDAMRQAAGTRPIFIHAGSFGTTAALCVAARRPVAGLVLQNPPPLKQLILGRYGWWNLWLVAGPVAMRIPSDLDSIENARRATAPAIFLLSGADTVIPPKYHHMVVDVYAGPKRVIDIPGAGHDDALPHEAAEALSRDRDWLWQLGRPRS